MWINLWRILDVFWAFKQIVDNVNAAIIFQTCKNPEALSGSFNDDYSIIWRRSHVIINLTICWCRREYVRLLFVLVSSCCQRLGLGLGITTSPTNQIIKMKKFNSLLNYENNNLFLLFIQNIWEIEDIFVLWIKEWR